MGGTVKTAGATTPIRNRASRVKRRLIGSTTMIVANVRWRVVETLVQTVATSRRVEIDEPYSYVASHPPSLKPLRDCWDHSVTSTPNPVEPMVPFCKPRFRRQPLIQAVRH